MFSSLALIGASFVCRIPNFIIHLPDLKTPSLYRSESSVAPRLHWRVPWAILPKLLLIARSANAMLAPLTMPLIHEADEILGLLAHHHDDKWGCVIYRCAYEND